MTARAAIHKTARGRRQVRVTGAHPSVTAGDGDKGKAYLCVWRAAKE
ncbi:hypothetical protein [Fimbriiglobus ruber]|nr:hypothetical protein [Fimbriiglobus ruber]